MTKVLGCVTLVLGLSCMAFGDFVADGNLSEWGVTPGSDWQNDVGAKQWLETWVGDRGYVGPGYGGQEFNVEAMYATADCTNLYYAIVTGFPDVGACSDGKHYPGDILIDLAPAYVLARDEDPTGPMEFAIETTTYDSAHSHGGKAGNNQGAGSLYSDVTVSLASLEWDHVYYPVEIKRTGYSRNASATLIGQTDFAYNDDTYGSDHYVIEGIIPLLYFGDPGVTTVGMSWTMTCANDIGSLEGEFPMCEIPEPGTLLLVGSGCLFGIGCYLRRRMK